MVKDDLNSKKEQLKGDTIFAPVDEIKRFEQFLNNLEHIQRELLKVAEGMKPVIE